jgi:translation initiation factor 2 subunit 1
MDFRMYENELPKEGDLVMVKIISVGDNGAKCQLLEYGGREAMLPCTEYSRKRIRSVKKIVRPGKRDVLTVINVDNDKKYIDLSKKHVTKAEIADVESRFQKSSFVHSCMQQLSRHHQTLGLPDMYQRIAWPMYHEFGHAFNGLEQAARNIEILQKYTLDQTTMNQLRQELEHRFQEKPKDVRCVVTVSCIGVDGVDAIKDALQKAEYECNASKGKAKAEAGGDDESETPLEITILRCPEYTISTTGLNIERQTKKIQQAIDLIKQSIESCDGGIFQVTRQIEVQ